MLLFWIGVLGENSPNACVRSVNLNNKLTKGIRLDLMGAEVKRLFNSETACSASGVQENVVVEEVNLVRGAATTLMKFLMRR